MDHEAGPSRQRSVFSCSPRDFHLPQSIIEVEDVAVPRTPESRIPIPAKRHTPARCVPAVLRDKNKMRVAELLQEERAPSCFEIASEARLQRHLMGQTSLQDHVSRRVRRSRIAQERGVLVTSLLGVSHDEEEEEEENMSDLDPMALPPADDGVMCEDVDVPLAWAMPPLPPHPPTASPRTGTKRKWDDDTCMTRRRPAPLPPWVANASTHIASPRWPLWSASGGGTVSPSSSPLAHSGTTTRRVPTPVLSSNAYCHGHARAATPPAIAIPRPMSPTLSAWQPLARSPGSGGSGPGYGSGAIGLRLGSRVVWDTAHVSTHAEGHDMDEGVRMMGLS